MTEFHVKAEFHEGGIGTLRKFATRDAAESHPVKLSLWRRVWIEEVDPAPPKTEATLRRPWEIEEPFGSCFTYLRDADGSRIATLYGRVSQRARTVGILRDAGLLE